VGRRRSGAVDLTRKEEPLMLHTTQAGARAAVTVDGAEEITEPGDVVVAMDVEDEE
jgi:hypothetical protein